MGAVPGPAVTIGCGTSSDLASSFPTGSGLMQRLWGVPARLRGSARGWTVAVFLLAVLALPVGRDRVLAGQESAADAALALDQKIITEAKEHSEIITNLTYLSDVIGPRLTGSANLKRANEWAAEKMKSYGLENVRLEAWEIPVAW